MLDVAALGRRELESLDDPPGLGRVVVADRGLEMLSEGLGLAQLPAQPAAEADAGSSFHRLHAQTASLLAVTKPSFS